MERYPSRQDAPKGKGDGPWHPPCYKAEGGQGGLVEILALLLRPSFLPLQSWDATFH